MQPRRPSRPYEDRAARSGAARARRPRREHDELRRALRRADEFSAIVASVLGHDLRTPLAAAALSAEVILRSSADERALRAASRVLSSTRRMERLVEQLLDYCLVRQGRPLPVARRDCDLGVICRTLVAEAVEQGEARVELEEQGDPLGEWDPDRLAEVVSSLLANALRHGVPGRPVRVRLDGRAPDTVELSVQNAGCVDAAAVPVLFEPLQGTLARAAAREGTRAHARAGEGLGLFVGREIVRAHGGELAVDLSDPGGTAFLVSLPRRAATL